MGVLLGNFITLRQGPLKLPLECLIVPDTKNLFLGQGINMGDTGTSAFSVLQISLANTVTQLHYVNVIVAY